MASQLCLKLLNPKSPTSSVYRQIKTSHHSFSNDYAPCYIIEGTLILIETPLRILVTPHVHFHVQTHVIYVMTNPEHNIPMIPRPENV